MKLAILAAVAAATLVGAAPAAMAQPYGYYHHRHFYGPGFYHRGYRHYFGGRRFCYYHPYRC